MKLEDLRRRQHESVGFLLIRAGQLWNERAINQVNALAGAPVLRESHTRLLPLLLRPDGARVTELARRLGLTKQTVQPLVAELKALGVVTTKPDERDGRAIRVVLTAQGLKGIASGNEVLKQIESELVEDFGRSEMKSLRKLLTRLLLQLEDEGD
ncbi:MAG: MarR family transcriptional regulator [Polyangiaceae bacterium]